jgi:hypothetical protein
MLVIAVYLGLGQLLQWAIYGMTKFHRLFVAADKYENN